MNQIYGYFRNSNWDTRTAASWALEEVAKNAIWTGGPLSGGDEQGQLTLDKFNLNLVLSRGTALVGSSGGEYDEMLKELSKMDSKERLLAMRNNLMQRIGIGAQFMDNIVGEDDDIIDVDAIQTASTSVSRVEAEEKNELYEGLSAREKMRLKRKNRMTKKNENVNRQVVL